MMPHIEQIKFLHDEDLEKINGSVNEYLDEGWVILEPLSHPSKEYVLTLGKVSQPKEENNG